MRPAAGHSLSHEAGEILMMNRRGFLLMMTTGLVALGLVVGTAIADELMGMITKVDVDGKLLTVVPKDSSKEVKVKVTDKTEVSYKGGYRKIDLEKLERKLQKAQDEGRKGLEAKIIHEKEVASKIEFAKKKASQ
jgi:hypothetical protein